MLCIFLILGVVTMFFVFLGNLELLLILTFLFLSFQVMIRPSLLVA